MPRSRTTMSALTPSSTRASSPSANDVRSNRVSQATSAASSAKCSSAAGSRSMPISVPPEPRRSAISRAWPAPPTVQSIAVCPGCGSSASISSPARTGTWLAVMSSRMVKTCGELGDAIGRRLVLGLPGAAIPGLEVVAGPENADLALQPGVGDQLGGQHHATRAVELGVEGRAEEAALELLVLARERIEPVEGPAVLRFVLGLRPDLDARAGAPGEHDAVGQHRAELGGHGEPVLGVEREVEGATEGHVESPWRWAGPRWRSGRSPATPVRLRGASYPTFPHSATQLSSIAPQTLVHDTEFRREARSDRGSQGGRTAGAAAPATAT